MNLSSLIESAGQVPKRLRLAVPLALIVAAVPALIVFASHQFADVPDAHPFHDNVSNLANSGITRGCGGGNFCPQSEVSRGQMAAFLTRGLGRGTGSSGSVNFLEAATTYAASVTMKTGGTTGGTGFVLVTASATAYTDAAGDCPCEVGVYVDGPAESSPAVYFDVSDTATPTTYRNGSGSVGWVFPAPSGVNQTFNVAVDVAATNAMPTGGVVEGSITAVYVPFGSTGTSTLSTSDMAAKRAESSERKEADRPVIWGGIPLTLAR